ncbi:hypothetical protein [Lentibacillus salicampi]|uniref:DUF4181 domain-containing protein n=1 Tax=Lentibacillus salicampi TaxID=175306 RepID=A0A4Y9ABX1_9BACI|nr:hypothetical protein [Lentibacillus salicampi]TFJ93409.1 hypothetical protein E4U82_07010 [Lentibacillus salicampi]
MRNPYEKYIRIELLTLALAVVIGMIAIVQGYLLIMLFCVYLLAFSMFCEGFLHINTNHAVDGFKQFVKAGMLILIVTVLFFSI